MKIFFTVFIILSLLAWPAVSQQTYGSVNNDSATSRNGAGADNNPGLNEATYKDADRSASRLNQMDDTPDAGDSDE